MLITSWLVAGAFVLLVSASILGYACLARLFFPDCRSPEVLGLGVFCALSTITGIAGGYTFAVQSALVGLGVSGLWSYPKYLRDVRGFVLPKGRDWYWVAWPALYYLARAFTCGLPQQHSDPLYYHLAAPKLWATLAQIRLVPEHPSFAQAALWEPVFGLPQIWLGAKGLANHVTTQIYGQWMHMLWGQIGTTLAGAALLKIVVRGLKPGIALFAAWLATTLPAFEWTGCLAKNDYIIVLFFVAAIIEAVEERYALAGLLAGFACGTKILSGWGALGLLALVPLAWWPRYALAAFIGILPVLIRNYAFTGNPVFPILDRAIGPHWTSELWTNHNLSFGGGPRFDFAMLGWLWEKMLEKPLPKILVALGAAALARGYLRMGKFPAPRLFLFLAVPLALALLMLRPPADGRYGNYIAAALTLFAMAAVLREALAFSRGRKSRAWWLAIPFLALGAFVNTPVDELWKVPRDYLFAPRAKYVEQFHPVHDAITWANAHENEKDRMLWTAEKELFYYDHPYETVSEMSSWETILKSQRGFADLVRTLKGMGFRYVHFSPQAGGYPEAIRPYWHEIVAASRKAILRTPTSFIFDLRSF
jgi:hypothetical protein